MRQKASFYPSLTFDSEFSFSLTGCHTKFEDPSLLYYLPIVKGRRIKFITFPSAMCDADYLVYYNNDYTTRTYFY